MPDQARPDSSKEDLDREAERVRIKGRSRMTKAELRDAIDGAG